MKTVNTCKKLLSDLKTLEAFTIFGSENPEVFTIFNSENPEVLTIFGSENPEVFTIFGPWKCSLFSVLKTLEVFTIFGSENPWGVMFDAILSGGPGGEVPQESRRGWRAARPPNQRDGRGGR